MTFLEWYNDRQIDDALTTSLSRGAEQSGGVDDGYDHCYLIELPEGDPRNVKQAILKRIQINQFKLYPSDFSLTYDGAKNGKLQFSLCGNLAREVQDEPGWLPSKGVYSPNKVVNMRMGGMQ